MKVTFNRQAKIGFIPQPLSFSNIHTWDEEHMCIHSCFERCLCKGKNVRNGGIINLSFCNVHTKDEKHTEGLVQDCSNSSVLAMELLQSCCSKFSIQNDVFTDRVTHLSEITYNMPATYDYWHRRWGWDDIEWFMIILSWLLGHLISQNNLCQTLFPWETPAN